VRPSLEYDGTTATKVDWWISSLTATTATTFTKTTRDGGNGNHRAHGECVTDDYNYMVARNADVSIAGFAETKRFRIRRCVARPSDAPMVYQGRVKTAESIGTTACCSAVHRFSP